MEQTCCAGREETPPNRAFKCRVRLVKEYNDIILFFFFPFSHIPPTLPAPFLHPMYYSYHLLTLPKYKSAKLFLRVDSRGAWSFGIMFKTYPKVWLRLVPAPGACSSTLSCTTLISLIGSLNPTAEGQIDIQPTSVIRLRQLHILKSFNQRSKNQQWMISV